MVHLGEVLGRLLGPLLKTCLPLMKIVLTPLAKLIRISNRCSYSEKNSWIKHASFVLSKANNIIISNKKMEDFMKIVKSLE